MTSDGANTLLLDPTVGIVARTGYDALLQGKPVTALHSFWGFNAGRAIGSFEATVRNALEHGLYRPGDALYYSTDLGKYDTLPTSGNWQTPALSGPLIR
jgi:hypothetical protein